MWKLGFPKGLARTLSHLSKLNSDPPLSARCDGSTLLELATGLAKPSPFRVLRRPLYQVVSPTPREATSRLCPTVGDFPTKIKALD